jgi:hypothetical protein
MVFGVLHLDQQDTTHDQRPVRDEWCLSRIGDCWIFRLLGAGQNLGEENAFEDRRYRFYAR